MNFRASLVYYSIILLIFSGSCSEYQKLLNGDDTARKYKEAELYYNSGEYKKANRLFEQIVPKYRGKPQAERLMYFFADSYFQLGQYLQASYRFENFVKSYPKSQRLEEANFKSAKSYYHLSPRFSLDQEDTFTAIQKLQAIINTFPDSEHTQEANQMILELQTKLEKKGFEISKQYYTIRDYKAAVKSLDNFIASFPGTKFRENALFYKFSALYEIAINSIESKKLERLDELKGLYGQILRYYPETVFMDDLQKKMQNVNSEIQSIKNQNTTLTK